MQVRDIFIKHDARRERWCVQPMGWLATALAAILIASLTSGVWRMLAGPQLQVTPTVQPTTVRVERDDTTPRPTATSVVRGCPKDPALWTLVPYDLPGAANTGPLYVIDPPCVVEQVEKAFARCTDLKAERGRHWSEVDEELCYSTAGFTTILGGEQIPALAPGWSAYGRCVETEKEDGLPVTSADLHFVFYTISEDKRVADVLVVNDAHPDVRTYDCETGELIEEMPGDPMHTAVVYYPLLYEDGRWRLGYRHDVGDLVLSDGVESAGMVGLVRNAQGR